MELVDTHCHLQFENYHGHEDEYLARASAAGVKKIICVGTSLEDSHSAIELADKKQNVWASAGSHPHEAEDFLADVNSLKKLKELAGRHKVVAIGETGLDYYKMRAEAGAQQTVFHSHIAIAQQLDLPLIMHVRDAWDDFWKIVAEYRGLRGVVHSFSSGTKQAGRIIDHGFYIGLNGIMTFTRDEAQLAAAKTIPLERLLLETDAPFLTPGPERGGLNEPSRVSDIAGFLAELRAEELSKLAAATTANANELFSLT